MTEIAELLPLAAGVIISPLPIVAVVALLLTARGRLLGTAFAVTYLISGLAVTLVAVLGARGVTRGADRAHDVLTVLLAAILTVTFLVLAALAWRGRPRDGRPAVTPRWLAAVETLSPRAAVGLGVVLVITDGKNIGLQLRAGVVIDGLDHGLAVLIPVAIGFALVAGLGVLTPVLMTLAGPPSVQHLLGTFKDELVRHSAAMMTVLFTVLAALEASHVVGYLLR